MLKYNSIKSQRFTCLALWKHHVSLFIIISTDEDSSLRIESFAIMNLRDDSTKLNNYIVFTMQTHKELSQPLSK